MAPKWEQNHQGNRSNLGRNYGETGNEVAELTLRNPRGCTKTVFVIKCKRVKKYRDVTCTFFFPEQPKNRDSYAADNPMFYITQDHRLTLESPKKRGGLPCENGFVA